VTEKGFAFAAVQRNKNRSKSGRRAPRSLPVATLLPINFETRCHAFISKKPAAAQCRCAAARLDQKFRSEAAELPGAIADQALLGLLMMVEHHLAGLSPDARLRSAPLQSRLRLSRKTAGHGQMVDEPSAGLDLAHPAYRNRR
jgi:hypothetical protein